jgi:hypothetical protein
VQLERLPEVALVKLCGYNTSQATQMVQLLEYFLIKSWEKIIKEKKSGEK